MNALRDILQGKPIRHPLHPLLVHLPIGFFTLSLVLDGLSHVVAYGGLVPGAFYALATGLVTSVIAAVAGFVDYADIRQDHPAKRIATLHMLLNLVMVGAFAVSFGLRWGELDMVSTPPLPLLLSVVGFAILSVSGYLGGRMVYDDGIGVGRHRRRTEKPQQTIGIAVPPAREGEVTFVPVANVGDLKAGETLRVEVDGHVMCIARIGQNYFAIQEFCTHRFGPLSEACFRGTEIECPWHRSRFDLRTGKVVHGPAKVDLRTWPVEIREGKICVGLTRVPRLTQPELLPATERKHH